MKKMEDSLSLQKELSKTDRYKGEGTMGKIKHKKGNRRLKKTVRIVFGAVCMLTAILIALVPVPDIKADTLSPYAYPDSTAIESAISAHAVDTDGIGLTGSGTNTKSSYTVSYRSNIYWYERQFDYFTVTVSSAKRAVLSKYNDEYGTNSITVPSFISADGYNVVTEEEYTSFKQKIVNSPITYEMNSPSSNKAWFFQKYANSQYEKYMKAYADYEKDTKGEILEPDPLTMAEDALSENQLLSYYCDKLIPGYQDKGYALTQVYIGGGTEILVPDTGTKTTSNWAYIPKKASKEALTDENGFMLNGEELIPVLAIGDNAFKNTQNAKILNIEGDIKYIGESAFEDSYVSKVDFGDNIKSIGHQAFKNCTRLEQVAFGNSIEELGVESFYGTYLKSVTLPTNIKTVGLGSFASCVQLTAVDLSGVKASAGTLGDYAFFNDYAINTLTMEGTRISKIGKAAFAATSGITGSLTEFKFPSNMSTEGSLGDYILAGRTNLLTVTMPADYGRNSEVTVPNGIFTNCINLEKVIFPDDGQGSCAWASYLIESEKATLFSGVYNKNLCVYGPELAGTERAKPRTSTWRAYTAVSKTVPYIYIGKDKLTYIEISDGQYLLTANKNGELVSCIEAPGSSSTNPIPNITIPSKVGEYAITKILPGCFSDSIKKRVQSLTIEDDSIKEIGDNVFSGCDLLENVSIGNSVASIGANAFKNCPLLTDVYFSTPASYTDFKMGSAAFETGSNKLTFHGDLVEGYAPYEWAMDYTIDTQGTKSVAYKSNTPTNLTVISYKQKDGTADRIRTLVDYPLYENIDLDNKEYREAQVTYYRDKYPEGTTERDNFENWLLNNNATDGGNYSILKKYEKQEAGNAGELAEYEILTAMEQEIIRNTQNITVPKGVNSFDAKDFFTQNISNLGNIQTYVKDDFNNSGVAKQSIFKKDEAGTEYSDTVYGGLFSGKLVEGNSAETMVKGNDRVSSITFNSVSVFPDHAFDSCENLESVDIGNATDVGTAPFAGCYKLTNVICKEPYVFERGILYKKNSDDTLTIVEVLPARGNLIIPKTISLDSDPLLAKVSAIEEGAFQNCKYITKVDLSSASKLKVIPNNCFNSCVKLTAAYLPDSVNEIKKNAFTETTDALTVEIPGTEVFIDAAAFKHNTGVIRTYRDSAAYTYAITYNIDVELLGTRYIVSFVNYDGTSLGADQKVESGKDAIPPEEDPVRVGYSFTGWNKSYKNITANTIIMAMFTSTGEKIVLFLDYNGNVLSEQAVAVGGSAVPPANPVRTGYTFTGWSGTYTNITKDTTLIAQYTANSSNNGNSGNNGGSSKDNDNDSGDNNGKPTASLVKVINGTGGGYYTVGSVVYISAFAAPAGKHFDKWTTTSNGVGLANPNSKSTSFTMPWNYVEVTANFADGPETASSNNTVTPATTTGGTGGTGGSGGSRGSSGTDSNSTGTKEGGTVISITKPGFSDTDKASAVVHGSTDNYIIKITEDADAQAQIEAALLADAETLENIKYFPMDISLYDSTGTTKITDTSGITIDITIPLPDELREYGGNNKVAGVVEGKLDKLTPTFKSIDGVPCVTFTASHFSPYTIYVDTANLSDGSIDSSPKTGDPIHPKWFLVIGLTCISILLFLKKDVKRTIKIS